jgi:hypothetical protein
MALVGSHPRSGETFAIENKGYQTGNRRSTATPSIFPCSIKYSAMTAKHKVATPVNWKQGEDVIIAGSVSDEDAKKTYPQGWKAPKPYIRIVPQPKV